MISGELERKNLPVSGGETLDKRDKFIPSEFSSIFFENMKTKRAPLFNSAVNLLCKCKVDNNQKAAAESKNATYFNLYTYIYTYVRMFVDVMLQSTFNGDTYLRKC